MTIATYNEIGRRTSFRNGKLSATIGGIIAGLQETRRREWDRLRPLRPYSYIEENLLDDNLGPEIARTLK